MAPIYVIIAKLLTQVFSTLVNNLTLAHAQLDGKLIETATDALANAHRIAFLGVGGGSANIAGEGASRFFQLGIPSEALTEGYLQPMLAKYEVGRTTTKVTVEKIRKSLLCLPLSLVIEEDQTPLKETIKTPTKDSFPF